jgi:ankyrin repeat protein
MLSKLPKSLDETYERVLREIDEANQDDVYRLLQCLVVSIRPLRVEELAEVLAVDLDGTEGIPKLNPDWRWEDQEEALQVACSSLIAIVDTGDSRVVQFSHFSVKEFLTSPRLADSSIDVSRYYISLEPAHTILAQSCLGVLLRLPVDDHVHEDNIMGGFPLAGYAARHWVDHAQFGNVSSYIWKGMEYLFDPNKPHFSVWLRVHDIDTSRRHNSLFSSFTSTNDKSDTSLLYYATLCGFHDVADHLIVKHLQDVNSRGGHYVTPLVAALAGKYFHVAELLYQHGANVDVRGGDEETPLHGVSVRGETEIVQWLLSHGADSNTRETSYRSTPLHYAAANGHLEAARILLQHNADIKARNSNDKIPLHLASEYGRPNVAELLLGYGVDVNARDKDGSTPLHLAPRWQSEASREGKVAVARLLLKHRADLGAKDSKGRTAFQVADEVHFEEMKKLLSDHIAN